MFFDERPVATKTDKLCCLALAGILVATTVVYEMTDGAALRATEADKPPVITLAAPAIDFTPLLEATEQARAASHLADVPLSLELKETLWRACDEHGVPVHQALGLIEVESGFDPDANSGVSRGLMQLNDRYFPTDLSPAENIQAGVAYLGELLERYDNDTQAALRAYNRGFDDGDRVYARSVMDVSEKYRKG